MVRYAAIMLALFIPWGIDDQNQRFLAAESFVSLWAEAKETLSPRLKFHVDNFESLRKSREDVHADRKRRDTQWGKGNEDTHGSDVDAEDFAIFDSDDEGPGDDKALFQQDISNAINCISSSINTRRDLWAKMVDKQKVSVLADVLKKPGQRVGKGMSFGKFAGSARLKEMAEDWNISLKQQQWDAKVLECGREVVGDRPVKKNRHS